MTITLAFEEFAGTADDEAPVAEQVARLLGTDHLTVSLSRKEVDKLLIDFLDTMDQPTTDGLNTFLVSYVAAKHGIKVALSGLGGDELFAGYPSFDQVPKLVSWGRFAASQSIAIQVQKLLRLVGPGWLPPKAAGLLSHSNSLARAYLLRRSLHLEDDSTSCLMREH